MHLSDHEFSWLNEPRWESGDEALVIHTAPDTDYWQRTHYGFRRDNAHALIAPASEPFTLSARFQFTPNSQYDQCGLLIRIHSECWFKCSIEFEDQHMSRLGSVTTNQGYSDWATQDISSDITDISYRLEFGLGDFIASYRQPGAKFVQMRVGHLMTGGQPIYAGIYGCSPKGPGFTFRVSELLLQPG